MGPKKDDKLPKRKTSKGGGGNNNKNTTKPSRELYCVCHLPWDGNSLMVQCDDCFDWFHPKCIGVSSREAQSKNSFICPQCQYKPILKLLNYKMESFKKQMQFSYFENSQMAFKERLFQIYAFVTAQISDKTNKFESIFDSHELNAINNLNLNGYSQFIKQCIYYATQKKNKTELAQTQTILCANEYIHSCVFAKHLDLIYFSHKSKANTTDLRNKNIISCSNCNGQIPIKAYISHLNLCLTNIRKTESTEKETKKFDFFTDFLSLMDCDSEMSDFEIDINNRTKVIQKLVTKEGKNRKRNNFNAKTTNLPPKKCKDLQIFHKIYTKLLQNERESRNSASDNDNDSDMSDDIPIAVKQSQNKNKNKNKTNNSEKYTFEYQTMANKFRKYKHLSKTQNLKAKQKNYYKIKSQKLNKKNNKSLRNATLILSEFYKSVLPLHCNANDCDELLVKLQFCNGNKLGLKHCGFVLKNDKNYGDSEKEINQMKTETNNSLNSNENEHKTMRIETNESKMEIDSNEPNTAENEKNSKYFCDLRLSKNGICEIHKNWRIKTYKELCENLENETKEIFHLQCLIKELESIQRSDTANKERIQSQIYSNLRESLGNNNINSLFDGFQSECNPSNPFNIDYAKQTDIDYLLKTKLNNNIGNSNSNNGTNATVTETETIQNILDSIQNQAILFGQ